MTWHHGVEEVDEDLEVEEVEEGEEGLHNQDSSSQQT